MIKTTKNILLTFDYELFLGKKTGSIEKCMIEPTERLKTVLDKYKAKGIFFVDTLCLTQIQLQPELNEAFNSVINQLQNLAAEGHYIFPHIHPHWKNAVYKPELKQFDLSNLSKYSLASCSKSEIEEFFLKSVQFLQQNNLSSKNYGYRAGGWCLQPFSLFKESFIKNNIVYDFSVLPGYKNENPSQAFNYTLIESKIPYYFNDILEKKQSNGKFTELPISTISVSKTVQLKDKFRRKYLWKTGDKGSGDGLSAQTVGLVSIPNNEMVSIDALTSAKLNTYKRYLKNNDYMHWISHPKMFTKHGLKCFENFIKTANQLYKCEYDFKNMLPN